MKKQAKMFQAQMAKMQEDMQNLEVSGSAGNGLVKVTLSGEKMVKNIIISPECVDRDDIEGLQDLIIAAFNDAVTKVEENSPTSGLGGLNTGDLPFAF